MIIKGSVPPVQLKNLIATKPMYRSLFVRTDIYPEVRNRLTKQGTIEHKSIEEIKNLIREQALHKGVDVRND
jgi:coenzyme F420-reducing hydrogenase beta subunit